MQHVMIVDNYRYTAKTIKEMKFWEDRNDFVLKDIIEDEEETLPIIRKNKPDIIIIVSNYDSVKENSLVNKIQINFPKLIFIVIGMKDSYEEVRGCFLVGAFDYLVQPVAEKELISSFLRIYDSFGIQYIANNLTLKIDALIDNLFLGGGEEKYICEDIIDQIYLDHKNDAINSQIVSDKAKKYIYEVLIERKTWLEKFIFRDDFACPVGFEVKTRADVKENWFKCFHEVALTVKKYQMVDNKLVYPIGKYVVVHVDEKLTLESVAKGVFLNKSYVSHIFKKITGMSFIDYLVEVKVDRAKILLRDSNIRIYDIAASIGYSNPEYFTKNFKKKIGMSPSAYRQRVFNEFD